MWKDMGLLPKSEVMKVVYVITAWFVIWSSKDKDWNWLAIEEKVKLERFQSPVQQNINTSPFGTCLHSCQIYFWNQATPYTLPRAFWNLTFILCFTEQVISWKWFFNMKGLRGFCRVTVQTERGKMIFASVHTRNLHRSHELNVRLLQHKQRFWQFCLLLFGSFPFPVMSNHKCGGKKGP